MPTSGCPAIQEVEVADDVVVVRVDERVPLPPQLLFVGAGPTDDLGLLHRSLRDLPPTFLQQGHGPTSLTGAL